MDVFGGLASVGAYFTSKEKEPREDTNIGRIRRTPLTGESIYESNDFPQDKRLVNKIASERFKRSKKMKETGIVPPIYNQLSNVTRQKQRNLEKARKQGLIEGFGDDDSVFSDDGSTYGSCDNLSLKSVNADHLAFFKRGNMLKDNKRFENKILTKQSNNGEPGFFSQFEQQKYDNPSDPVSSNNIQHQTGKFANMSRLETERKLAMQGNFTDFSTDLDMTYGVVDEKDFVHNNMVPFFKRGIGKGYGPNSEVQKKLDDVKQRKVDTFTGSIKNIEYRPKTERRPLFNPQVGNTWIYGMPNFTDYFQSRYIPGRERRNEKLMQETRITPGLNLNYNEVSKQGFNDTWRALPKTVDELRTANNPKVSYGRPIIPGLKAENRSIIPNMAKRRPVTYKENDPRDLVKGLSYYRAPSIYGDVDMPSTNRQMTTKAWFAPAKFDSTLHKPESLYEQHKISHKENFKSATPINTTGVDRAKNTSYTANTYFIQPTNRNIYGARRYVDPVGGEIKKSYAWDYKNSIPDATLRNVTEVNGNLQPAGPQWQKSYAWDYKNSVPDATLRNVTEVNGNLQPAGPQWQKSYAWDYNNSVPDATLRNVTEVNGQLNPAGPEWQKSYAWDYKNSVPDATLRNVTEVNGQLNPAGPEWQKSYAWDYKNSVPDATLRNVTEVNGQLNPAGPEWQKSYAWDYKNSVPDATLRNVTEVNGQLNPAGPEWQKSYAWDYKNSVPDATLRNVTEINSQLNPAGPEWQKSYAWDYKNSIPDPTLRNVTEVNSQLNPAGPEWQKSYAWDYKNSIPDPTLRNTTEVKSQLNPAGPEWQKSYAWDYKTSVPDPTLRNTTEVNSQLNPAGPEWQKGGYQAAQAGTIAKPTMRQLSQNTTQYGPLGFPEKEKGGYQVAQAGTIAKPTMRQLTQNTTQYGPLGFPEKEKGGYQVAVQNTIAPPTMRQLTQNTTQYNPVTLHEGQKTRTRSDANNSLVNHMKEQVAIVRDGGAPTTSNYNKIPTYEHTMVELCEPIQIDRDVYGDMHGQRPLQCVPTMYTRIANVLPQQSWRFDTCITENLKLNPYINNTQHRSVEYSVGQSGTSISDIKKRLSNA
jgi:hypothetical protein